MIVLALTLLAQTSASTTRAQGTGAGNLSRARGHWVSEDVVLWDLAGVRADWTVRLHHAADASLALDASGIVGGSSIALTLDPAGAPAAIREKFPHLAGYAAFRAA